MAQIRFTFQQPDGTEFHDALTEEKEEKKQDDQARKGFSVSQQNSLFHKTVASELRGLSVTPDIFSRRGSTLTVSPQENASGAQQRKFSFPATLPSSFPSSEPSGMGFSARRRFSNVSDAVARKLSHTIGWRSGQAQLRETVAVGRCLCSQYVRFRLKRAGCLDRKCGLRRLRSAADLPNATVFREVYPELLALGKELERLHPKVYANVTRQASFATCGKLTSSKEPGAILTAVSRELFKNQEPTWGKVVSLYAVSGGLAVDCIKQGHHDYLPSIFEAVEEILEEDLAQWIQYKGGWTGLSALVKPPTSKRPSIKIIVFVLPFVIIMLFFVLILRFFGISSFM